MTPSFARQSSPNSVNNRKREDRRRNQELSTPEQKCIGLPEQKYISDAGKKGGRIIASFSSRKSRSSYPYKL
jgi:hypothetical protein